MTTHTSAVDDSVLIVQLSDSHLFADASGRLMGMDTQDTLQRVVAQLLQEQPQIDLLLATGDLSQDGSVESYQHFRRLTSAIRAPARWLAGNHDEHASMQAACVGTDLLRPLTDIGNWRVTMLDSAVPGAVPGYLSDSQLALLERALSEAPERHHLICLHHHPVSIGSQWMEPIGLRNPEALFRVLDRFDQVRAVLWGHVHQAFEQSRQSVRLLASPSTCIQFAPGSAEFKVENRAPGYRWLRLHADGRLQSGVSRLPDFSFEVDSSLQGY